MSKEKVSICVDARMIRHSGIGVYLKHIAEALLVQPNLSITFLGEVAELNKIFAGYSYKTIATSVPIYSALEQLILPFLIPECDIFWSPHFNIPLLPIRANRRIVTIHDVYHLEYASSFAPHKQVLSTILIRQACARSGRIITVSEFSREELLKRISVNSDKVVVIHNGVDQTLFREHNDPDEKQRVRSRYKLPERYILFVGNVKPNKNLSGLVKAFARLNQKLPQHKLLIVGKKEGFLTGDATLFTQIDADSRLNDRVVFTGYVENEDLPLLYSMADVFAFPSVYEGFGLPPLEAMACGCPVVVSDKASMPEICGDAAEYADPNNADQFANAIYRVITDDERRTELTMAGIEQVKRYDWSTAGRLFIDELMKMTAYGAGK